MIGDHLFANAGAERVPVSVVDDIKRRIDDRLAELEPLVQEYRELMALKRGFDPDGVGGDVPGPPAPDRGASRPRARATRRGGGGHPHQGRAEQAIRIAGAKPGVTVKEIAAEMGINENYLYRLLPRMEREGRLERRGRGWAVRQS